MANGLALDTKEEEEVVVRKKLIYDGHGMGDDKRLVALIKNITKLCFIDDSNEDSIKLCNTIQRDLAAATTCAQKHIKMSEMYERTYVNVQNAILDKTKELESIKEGMTSLQLELEFVEKLKKVEIYPDCEATKLAMQDVEKRKMKLIEKIERQKMSLQTLLEACKSLQKVVDETESSYDMIEGIKQVDSDTSPDEMSS